MKILYIALDKRLFINCESGGSTHIKSVINEWEKLGHEVKLLTSGIDNPPEKNNQNSGSFSFLSVIKKILPELIWLILRDLSDIFYNNKKYKEIISEIKDFKPDVIYERNCYLCSAGFEAAKTSKKPYFLEINAPIEERKSQFGAPLSFYHLNLEIKQLNFADGVIVVSSALRDYYINEGCDPDKIIFSPNGVDPMRFKNCKAKGAKLKEERNFLDKTIIGFIGKAAKYHSFDRLLEAACEVCNKQPDALFWIIGNSSEVSDLKELLIKENIESNFIFEGSVEKEKIPDYLGAFDIAILPNNAWYGSPTKLFEYAASGTPIIAPDTPAVLDVFTENECILISKEDNLAEAILNLINNRKYAESLALKMQRKVIESHTWKKVSSKIIDFIEQQLEK